MKKKLCVLLIACMAILLISGCTEQTATKGFGGSMTLELAPGQKLEEITWKDDSIWYLTRPMTEEDIAETHVFQQSSPLGVFEGKITIIESEKE